MSRDNPDDELKPIATFLPGLDLGAGLIKLEQENRDREESPCFNHADLEEIG